MSAKLFNAFIEEALQDEVGRFESFRLAEMKVPDSATVLKEKESGREFNLFGITLDFKTVYNIEQQAKKEIAEIGALSSNGLFFYANNDRVEPIYISGMSRSIIIKEGRAGIVFVERNILKEKGYVSNYVPYIVSRAGAVLKDEKGDFEKVYRDYTR